MDGEDYRRCLNQQWVRNVKKLSKTSLCTIPLGIVFQDLGRIGVEWTGSKGLEEKQLWLF